MAISKVFAVYDSKAGAYMNPFNMPTIGMAIRGFCEVVEDKSTSIGKHPEDFSLFELGVFDDAKGSYETLTAPKQLITAGECLVMNEKSKEIKND